MSGGRRRELELIRRLSERFDLHLMVVSKTVDEDLGNVDRLERFCRRVEVFPAEPRPLAAVGDRAPTQVARHRCPRLTRRVRQSIAAGGFELVHVEGFYLMQHLPRRVEPPVLLVEQNIEYELDRQRAALLDAAPPEGDRSRHWMATFRAEVAAWRRADALGVLTDEDRDTIRSLLPAADVRLVPDGADHVPGPGTRIPAVRRPDAPLVVFCGNFAYGPNVDAATFLCGEILPRIASAVPNVHAWLVGNDPPPAVRSLARERVRVTGRVPDTTPFIDAADVVVCPLRIGGGIKVKVTEALRRGKPVVASSIAAQGLGVEARRPIMIADDARAFAASVRSALTDGALRARLEREVAEAASLLPTWDQAADALAGIYGELAREASAAPDRTASAGLARAAGLRRVGALGRGVGEALR